MNTAWSWRLPAFVCFIIDSLVVRMKNRLLIFVICCVVTLSNALEVGNWEFGGKVSAVQLGTQYGIEAAVTAEYRMLTILTWRTDLEGLIHDMSDFSKTDVAVPTNILFYPLQSKIWLDPYAGPGLTYKYTYQGASSLGANILAGVNFLLLKGKKFGIEAKYTIEFLPRVAPGSFQIGLTGAWELKL
jgi:hypothetical protein